MKRRMKYDEYLVITAINRWININCNFDSIVY